MTSALITKDLNFEPVDNQQLASLCGQYNEHIEQIEKHFSVKIFQRGNIFQVTGSDSATSIASQFINYLYHEICKREVLTPARVFKLFKETTFEKSKDNKPMTQTLIQTRAKKIKAMGDNQSKYIKAITNHDINFGIGPAGTGKTYLAVAAAVEALEQQHVKRLVFVRPAIEAGEKLGFLPGDLEEKVLPYLRPLYDALYDICDLSQVTKMIETNVIEIAPLAFMRGRTLNDAFIILDEAQNTTKEQMKMFLTRIGFGSTAVITGDVTQIDLPKNIESGLIHAISVFKAIEGFSFSHFDSNDAVRHPLVQAIIKAYENHA